MTRTLSVATAPRKDSKHWDQRSMTWDEFTAWLDIASPADRKECGGYVVGELRDGQRTKSAVVSRDALALDADSADRDALLSELEARGWRAVAHTTYRSSPDAPRWRVLILLDRPVATDEYERLARFVMDTLGAGQFDPSSKEPERFMYKPSAPDPARYEYRKFDGEPLDVDAVLADAPAAEAEHAESEAVPEQYVPPFTDQHPDYVKQAVRRHLDEFLIPLAELTEGGMVERVNPATGEAKEYGWEDGKGLQYGARRLVELSNAAPSTYSRAAAEADFLALDPGGFARKFAHHWSDAVKAVGERAAMPTQASAQDDFGPLGPDEGDTDAGGEHSAHAYESEVERELARLEVRDEARRRFDLRRAPAPEPWDAGTLSEHLLKPPPPPARVDGLVPWEASTAIIAQRKAGKTTLELNLARSLITGEPFLGGLDVQPVEGKVALLNFEVSGAQIANWAARAGIPPDRLFIVNLRGAGNPFQRPGELARLAALLRGQEVESLIVDPFGRAFTGDNQNDAGQVQGWLLALDAFARRDVGALDVVLSVHAGWNGERTRGSSALEDWADSLVNLTRKEDESSGSDDRFIRADGRDVELAEDQLVFDPSELRLSLSGYGSRKAASAARKVDDLVPGVVAIVERHPGIKAGEIETRLREDGFSLQRNTASRAAHEAVERGQVETRPGLRNAKLFYPRGEALG